MRFFFLMLLSATLSCGENEEEEGVFDDKTLSLISSSSNLPTCNQGTAGKIVYVRDTDEFKFCESEAWVTIDIRGAEGANGTNGADGVAGS